MVMNLRTVLVSLIPSQLLRLEWVMHLSIEFLDVPTQIGMVRRVITLELKPGTFTTICRSKLNLKSNLSEFFYLIGSLSVILPQLNLTILKLEFLTVRRSWDCRGCSQPVTSPSKFLLGKIIRFGQILIRFG